MKFVKNLLGALGRFGPALVQQRAVGGDPQRGHVLDAREQQVHSVLRAHDAQVDDQERPALFQLRLRRLQADFPFDLEIRDVDASQPACDPSVDEDDHAVRAAA